MWDATNKARGTDDDAGAGQFKNFDRLYNDRLKDDPRIPGNDDDGSGKFKTFDKLWNDRLKDDPSIPERAKAGLKDLPHPLAGPQCHDRILQIYNCSSNSVGHTTECRTENPWQRTDALPETTDSGWCDKDYAESPTTVTFNKELKALGVDPNSAAADLIGSRAYAWARGDDVGRDQQSAWN